VAARTSDHFASVIRAASMTTLQQAWAALQPQLKILEPVPFSASQWSLLECLHANFNDRDAHAHLPLSIARFREAAVKAIYEHAQQFDDIETLQTDERWFADNFGESAADPMPPDPMAEFARLYNEDVDAMMGVLVPPARFRKGHYAYGRFTVAMPHGLHTDHSLEDSTSGGEPICIARIETLATHYITGDYRAHDAETQSMLKALRYWITVPEGEPEHIFEELLRRQTLKTIPLNHVMLMVAGNSSQNSQVTQHIAARPPAGGQHSTFFQRQYKLA
jgi:hypothetical protein